ncbi:DUF2934 domain-containing protein [Agrobacterium cavarae]|jgi:hypothetical protein|uniref:DUF2934 domain-containing protein n=1 Tax=Agrobacterium cavarae TaxID=2528239 RepID=UPI000714A683|nr:DUF2934 domain-containing protein [Agrobacterium cavarae]KQZ92743.1 hypothetical protein ASD74_19030 [Rhizobium sp. Root564]
MQVSEQEWISKRAYTLWESEGRPHGRDAEHWEQAKKEFTLLQSTKATKPAHRKKGEVKATSIASETTKPKTRAKKSAAQ